MDHPSLWKISARQAKILDTLCEHGSAKATGAALGVGDKAIEACLTAVRLASNAEAYTPRVRIILAWDRWKRRAPGDTQLLQSLDKFSVVAGNYNTALKELQEAAADAAVLLEATKRQLQEAQDTIARLRKRVEER